nr:MAG TPA: hypothetical protein [Caudoviricetes sp.]
MPRVPQEESGVVVSIDAYLETHSDRRSQSSAHGRQSRRSTGQSPSEPIVESHLYAQIDEYDDLTYSIDPLRQNHVKQLLLACLSMCIDLAMHCRNGDS